MDKNGLSKNQMRFLIEEFKRWGINHIFQDDSWQVEIGKGEMDDLIEQRYLVNVEQVDRKIKYNLSVKAQEFAEAYLRGASL